MRQIASGKKVEALELYLDGFSTNERTRAESPKGLSFQYSGMPERGNFPDLN